LSPYSLLPTPYSLPPVPCSLRTPQNILFQVDEFGQDCVNIIGVRTQYSPLNSLRLGNWFKLICGASYQYLPAVRNLTLAYTLAGADCIDVAADPAVIAAAQAGLAVAQQWGETAIEKGFHYKGQPLLMVSLNDGEDPHFRKAEFDSTACPTTCWRPCEAVCPAEAITFSEAASGVIDALCYGCGRCLPVCPSHLISARSYVSTPAMVATLLLSNGVDALEIHTQVGRKDDFKRLWQNVQPWVNRLKLISISCPNHPNLIDYLSTLYKIISPLPCDLIWQTDGRPMSGDIGAGTTQASIKLAQKVIAADLPGFVQLAGGTNQSTVAKLRTLGLLPQQQPISVERSSLARVGGVAYGSYARTLLSSILEQLESMPIPASTTIQPPEGVQVVGTHHTQSDLLWKAVSLAHSLVSQLKGFS
jgi:Fe-S-cluster-containing hydrogenase component 2